MGLSSLLFFLLLSSPVVAKEVEMCHICHDNDNVLDKAYCRDVVDEMLLTVEEESHDCILMRWGWYKVCCKEFSMNLSPPGTYPACDICGSEDGEIYPYKPQMLLNTLYIGKGTCAQYWEAGKLGQIDNCEAIQYFLPEPCGCGAFPFLPSTEPALGDEYLKDAMSFDFP